MPNIRQVMIVPSTLEVYGGPHSQPFGDLTAELFDDSHQPVKDGSLTWSVDNPSVIIQPDAANSHRVRVGCYRPVKATVTVREASSGRTAHATIMVHILDAGLPGPGRPAGSLADVVTGVRSGSGSKGRLVRGAVPAGEGSPPHLSEHSFSVNAGDAVRLRLSTTGQPSAIAIGAAEMDDHYEVDLQGGPADEPSPVELTIDTAESTPAGSFNLEIASRRGDTFSDRATPLFVQIKGEARG